MIGDEEEAAMVVDDEAALVERVERRLGEEVVPCAIGADGADGTARLRRRERMVPSSLGASFCSELGSVKSISEASGISSTIESSNSSRDLLIKFIGGDDGGGG